MWSRHSASRSAQTPTTEKPKARFCSLTNQPSFVVLDSGPTPAICVPREGEKYSLEAVSLGATRSDAIMGKNYRVEEAELVRPLDMHHKPTPEGCLRGFLARKMSLSQMARRWLTLPGPGSGGG